MYTVGVKPGTHYPYIRLE